MVLNTRRPGRNWKGIGVTLFLAAFAGWIWTAGLYYRYQGTLPRHPDPGRGNVYPLNVHGIVVYQTRDERNRLNEGLYISISLALVSGLISVIYQTKFK
jgi:hypothetical protein